MCLYPRLDLLDQPIVNSINCTLNDNCDYLAVDDRILIESEDIAVLQLNIRGLYGKIDKLKTLLNDSFKGKLLKEKLFKGRHITAVRNMDEC